LTIRGQKVFAGNAHTLTLKGTVEAVIGTAQADLIRGNKAANRIEGRDGSDTLYGNAGNDTLYGGPGDDWLYGDAGIDTLYGESGNNVLLGGAGNDVLDVLFGAEAWGRNLLIGGLGADILDGGPGEEILIGGTTAYDSKAAALTAVMRQWVLDTPFETRRTNLDAGVTDPLAGVIQLKKKDKTNLKGTVLDDKVRDQLFGGGGDDWLFDFAKDETDLSGG
jgi:Ca2+-binding RTX toxin-like protein